MAYSAHYGAIFAALGYPNSPYSGEYAWSSETPSAGIIAAVEALPDINAELGCQAAPLWNLDITTDADCLALQALVSGSAWTAFATWHNTQWMTACKTEIDDNSLTGFMNCCSLFNGEGFADCRIAAKAALTAAGITRHPF